MNKRAILYGIVIILILCVGIAYESGAAQKKQKPMLTKPKMGGTLVFAVGKEPANPNPFIATSSTTGKVKETTYEALLTHDDDDRIMPNLAEKYELSPDGSAVTLRLRKGAKFHNGQEMKADDVLWSANHVKDPKNGAIGHKLIIKVKTVEKIDDYAVKFTLHSPSVTFLFSLADIGMLPIVPANSLKPGQIKLEKNTFVPGTGPFIYEKAQPGFDTVMKKYPEYWGHPAYLDKIIFRPIADSTSRFNALRTGDVHIADRLAPLDVERIKKGSIKGLVILTEAVGSFRHIVFMNNNPLFQKKEMRQAVAYAIDKQRLVDEAYFGAATKAEFMIDPKSIWAKAASLPAHKHDVNKAKALLKAAGYKGQELTLMGRKSSAQEAESLQRMLGEAGIKVKLEIVEAGIMAQRVIDGQYDIHVDGGTVSPDPSDAIPEEFYTSKVDKGHYSNPQVDRLLDKLDKEFDEKKRLKIFKELAWTMYNYAGDVPLLFESRYTAMSDIVQGFGPSKGQSYKPSCGHYFKNAWLK